MEGNSQTSEVKGCHGTGRASADDGTQENRITEALDGAVVACQLCNGPTSCTTTKLCNRCWELRSRIERDPELTRRILQALKAETVQAWHVELHGAEAQGGGYVFVNVTDIEFLGHGEISFRDHGGDFHRSSLPYWASKKAVAKAEGRS